MIAAAPIVLEATADVSDDAADVEDCPPDAPALTRRLNFRIRPRPQLGV